MHRSIPVSNKLLSNKWEDRHHVLNIQKLSTMKPARSPIQGAFTPQPSSKLHKDRILEQRNFQIARDNEIQLKKIYNLRRPSRRMSNSPRNRKLSLNQESRTKKQEIYNRLHSRCSTYNIHRYDEDSRAFIHRVQNIPEFPHISGNEAIKMYGRKRGDSISLKSRKGSFENIIEGEASYEETVYEKCMNIGNRSYSVVMKLKNDCLLIYASDIELSEKFELELQYDKVETLLEGHLKYETLAKLLTIDQGNLRIKSTEGLHQPDEVTDKCEEISRYKRVVNGERDIVGGYMLSYTPKMYKYNSNSTNEQQPQVKQFFFVSSVKDENIWKLLQHKEGEKIRNHTTDFNYTRHSSIDFSTDLFNSSMNISIRRPNKASSQKSRHIGIRDFMSQATVHSSIRMQDSDSESAISEILFEDEHIR